MNYLKKDLINKKTKNQRIKSIDKLYLYSIHVLKNQHVINWYEVASEVQYICTLVLHRLYFLEIRFIYLLSPGLPIEMRKSWRSSDNTFW